MIQSNGIESTNKDSHGLTLAERRLISMDRSVSMEDVKIVISGSACTVILGVDVRKYADKRSAESWRRSQLNNGMSSYMARIQDSSIVKYAVR